MAINFEHAFVVKASADRVWAYLTDAYRVAAALPGAAITEKQSGTRYAGTMTVKVGPVSARYRGTVSFEALDQAAGTAEIVGNGQDTGGRGGANMKMKSRVVEQKPGETQVSVASELNVTGIMAQFGRGLIQDVSNQMLEKFTAAMRAELEKPEQAAPAAAREQAAKDEGAAGETLPASEHSAKPAKVEVQETRPAESSIDKEPPSPTPPIDVLSVAASGTVARVFGRPVFWIVVALVILAIYWLSRR